MKQLCEKIKKNGVFKSIIRAVVSPFYLKILKYYSSHNCMNSKIDEHKILIYSTPSFSDNSKAMYDYLVKENDAYKFICLLHREDKIPVGNYKNIKFMYMDSYYHKGHNLSAVREASECKYVFFTHTTPLNTLPSKKKGQLIINLWHGCGYKDTQQEKKSYFERNPFDYALVPGPVFIDTKEKFWRCKKEQILPIGYPRYDLLKKDNDDALKFSEKLKDGSSKLIVWMPTFRNTGGGGSKYPEEKLTMQFDLPLFSSVDDVVLLNKFCAEKNITICIKRHPKQVKYSCEDMKLSNIKFISNSDLISAHVDLYAFLRYTDALISDYSSVAIDYILLDKPMAFALDDMGQYKGARGFVFEDPLKYMPGHHLYTLDDINLFINDIAGENDKYSSDRAALMKEVHNPCDGYCKRVYETVSKLI